MGQALRLIGYNRKIVPTAFLGFALSCPVVKRIKQETFRKALLVLLGIAAASLFVKASPYFFA